MKCAGLGYSYVEWLIAVLPEPFSPTASLQKSSDAVVAYPLLLTVFHFSTQRTEQKGDLLGNGDTHRVPFQSLESSLYLTVGRESRLSKSRSLHWRRYFDMGSFVDWTLALFSNYLSGSADYDESGSLWINQHQIIYYESNFVVLLNILKLQALCKVVTSEREGAAIRVFFKFKTNWNYMRPTTRRHRSQPCQSTFL